MKKTDHAKHVDDWMDQVVKDAPATSLLLLFETAWAALWRRAEGAAGQVTLGAVAELVRVESVNKFPILSPLKLDATGLSCKALLDSADTLEKGVLQEGLRFMLVEFLTVLGDLTDQILTPGLYEELSRITPPSKSLKPDKLGPIQPGSRVVLKKEEIAMARKFDLLSTGVPNLDAMMAGGLIRGASAAIAGPPGAGKTILAQQIAFHVATPKTPVLYFSTLSEPGATSLFYLGQFKYFDPKKFDQCIHFVDLGVLLRTKGLPETLGLLLEHVKKIDPALIVLDNFKIFGDMAKSAEELRKFLYELVVDIRARKCNTLFIGEYAAQELESNPLLSIIDGIVTMTQRELSGEQQRFIQIIKMSGRAHSRDEHSFRITDDGIEIYAPRLTIKRSALAEPKSAKSSHLKIGIDKADDLLGTGIPRGSSLLIAGVAGTGKTVLGLEFAYRGAQAGEKGIVFSFEETDERLRAAARGLGWDLDSQLENGMVKIVFIPQPEILVERHLTMMREEIAAMQATRVVVDSVSVFLHKIKDRQIVREKVFQLASIVQNAGAVGFFVTDIRYGSNKISRFGVEETVVDGVIILSATEEALERERYIEVYKLRNTAHLKGRHTMTIDTGGIQIFPRYRPQAKDEKLPPPPSKIPLRLPFGVEGVNKLLGNGVLSRSMTLVSGSAGIGKSVLSLQFLLAGASRREPGLYVTLEESPEELIANAAALDLPLKKAIEEGLIEILYLPPTYIPSTQLITLLTDKIKEKKIKRMVLDSTTHIVASSLSRDKVRELLYDLIVRIKNLGVTSVFTLESDNIYSRETADMERGFTPLADNIIVLRYIPIDSTLASSLMVLKSRGSTHVNGVFSFSIAQQGLRLGPAIKLSDATAAAAAPTGRNHRRH